MAVTKIWKVEARLDKVIKYTTNIEKTKNRDYDEDLYNCLHHTKNIDYKKEKQIYVSGVNCSAEDAYKEMILTKKHFGKGKGILGYHGYQSFRRGEITAKEAHEIGVRLAEELWGDKYEVLVSTHLNTNCYHNHFVLNSVSFVNGEKYRNTRENYAMMRKISDELCREYNLSVIDEKPCGRHNIDYTKYYNSYIQKSDYYTQTKDDIDFAIKQASTYKSFLSILEKMEYKITIRAGKISIVKPPYKRNIRIERTFGIEYSIANITERIMNTDMIKIPFPEYYREKRTYTAKSKTIKIQIDRGSLYRLYLHYCYILKIFPKTTKNRIKMTKEMREEIKKMDKLSDDIKFLSRNKIKTTKELFSYKNLVTEELNKQMKSRNTLRRKREKETNPVERQKNCDEILVLTDKINYLKQEVRYCQDIEKQNQKIKINIQRMEEQEKNREKEQQIQRKENYKR